jgi:hypothetical protein
MSRMKVQVTDQVTVDRSPSFGYVWIEQDVEGEHSLISVHLTDLPALVSALNKVGGRREGHYASQ